MSLGISSVWRSKELVDGGALLDELSGLGFDGVELEYRVRAATLAQMAPRLGRDVPVLSVHAFFPRPEAAGAGSGSGANAFLFSDPDREAREVAVRHGVATIETAAALGARAVVLHLGRVAVAEEALAPYRRLRVAGDPDPAEVRPAVPALLAARAAAAGPHVEAVLRSLERLNTVAVRRGVLLGVENRYNPHEIPDFAETGRLLGEFRGGAVRFWLDAGHALYQEAIGVGRTADWLAAYGADAAGAHLHDIRGSRDHLAPGTGEADFAAIVGALPAAALRILEVRPAATRAEVLAGRDLLRGLEP
jgi:sugar phosphate isomerase/epimerase